MLGEMAIGRRGKSDAFGSYNNIKKVGDSLESLEFYVVLLSIHTML